MLLVGGRKGIWPVKTEVLAWLIVYSKMQMICIYPADATAKTHYLLLK